MAAPCKRICRQASYLSRAQPSIPRQSQQPFRSFTTTPTQSANPTHAGEESHFLTPFPESAQHATRDPMYEEDDISSLGHSELEQHRELRDMVRIAAWEMPLLTPLHQPFPRPDRQSLPLRWRYTTYMGEHHPASRKVVVDFQPAHLASTLTGPQRTKLCKLAGPRYNPTTGTIKMNCESFETQAQNKRFLADTISKLIAEAKDTTDTFADVPLDTRHVKRTLKPKFPREWLLTAERKAELESLRRGNLLEEGRKVEQNLLVSGVGAIEQQRAIDAKRAEEPVMAEARQPVGRGKMGRKEMGQQRVQR
ncbi:hypothetical protein D0869_04562 [Hortaea werneckii]|uniref:Small ribosomal subunit protein mS35 mitochondrial conserved domain-containing protein n=1 Tax=Hortaea werneckii TaxID=91943 RepID=A0A3M6WN76_HORWE|nr:hypothetical protein KC324_g5412 [Hortaea werneckii]KAI7577981.1 hypothetical protein KC316_g10070 [Hortaea werneckii]RMX79994.1 hypothetical protein D0868_16225 [Hortaea werneckii]RMX84455.1 hypothetical protein D0869_04562 [Hortaea werneckii]